MAAAAALRFAMLLLFWLAIAGTAALPVGLIAAALGTAASLQLMPPARLRPRPAALALLVLRFPWQALRAGLAVARIALDPRAAPRPGTIEWTPRLPPGTARDAFLAYASLLPGTLPAGGLAGGAVLIHALEAEGAVAEAMTAEEARFARAFGLDG
ncbi:Na+/H+ antiporter subunit E [Roseomonas sp. HF4]|uniref:Na+/H+ antiporter subunit E n=1 Tax=Roseomonas sp. HF4 TaxID=2562313 RepID=UPI0010C0C71B|nr:Na+/H+ antiporter subunit E [Roseomonas sp. HF4]